MNNITRCALALIMALSLPFSVGHAQQRDSCVEAFVPVTESDAERTTRLNARAYYDDLCVLDVVANKKLVMSIKDSDYVMVFKSMNANTDRVGQTALNVQWTKDGPEQPVSLLNHFVGGGFKIGGTIGAGEFIGQYFEVDIDQNGKVKNAAVRQEGQPAFGVWAELLPV